jgi:hypothetical protein
VVTFTHRPLYPPGERAPGTRRIEGWVGPRASLEEMEKRKVFPYRDSNSDVKKIKLLYFTNIDPF